jgi:hypothetical protein
MTGLRRYAANAVALAAIVLTFVLAERSDVGETSGGQLTGPMILACFAAVPVLLSAIVVRLWHPSLGIALWIGGTLLTVPLATWWLVPGWWSAIAPWPSAGTLPMFNLRWDCLILLACLFVALWLQSRPTQS